MMLSDDYLRICDKYVSDAELKIHLLSDQTKICKKADFWIHFFQVFFWLSSWCIISLYRDKKRCNFLRKNIYLCTLDLARYISDCDPRKLINNLLLINLPITKLSFIFAPPKQGVRGCIMNIQTQQTKQYDEYIEL